MKAPSLDDRTFSHVLAIFLALLSLVGVVIGDVVSAITGAVLAVVTFGVGRGWLKL